MTGSSPSRLSVRVAGNARPGRRPLVLLHGWSCHGGFFHPQLSAMADETLVVAPDLPGHGETAGRAELTIDAAADELAALVREHNLHGIVLVGWSMGAHVAYSYIERHGCERLSALVVEDMTAKVLNDENWQLGTRDGTDAERNVEILEAIVPYWPQLHPRIAEKIFARDLEPDADSFAFVLDQIARADPRLLRPMWASLTSQDFRALLPAIDVPTHLVSGARSVLYGHDVALWQAERIADATVHSFEASGHAPHLEEPGRFNALLMDLAGGSG